MPQEVPSTGDAEPPESGSGAGDGTPADRERAADALRAAFARLSPQGSDAWNFQAAFTHLGDRYGPYHPGASALTDALAEETRAPAAPRGRLHRLRGVQPRGPGAGPDEKTEFEDAMGHVVEAFRFLSARVAALEARVAAQDRPVGGAAWFVPARELGPWSGPVSAHVLARTPGGDIVHADCGEGALLRELSGKGVPAHGVEPRGAVALRALEGGSDVTIGEASEHLAGRPAASLGGVVLSGVVDRLPLHAVLPLLAECRRTLARGAPVVVVSEPNGSTGEREAPALDLVEGRPLHEATWELLLDRAGFVEVAPLADGVGADGRFAVAGAAPT